MGRVNRFKRISPKLAPLSHTAEPGTQSEKDCKVDAGSLLSALSGETSSQMDISYSVNIFNTLS